MKTDRLIILPLSSTVFEFSLFPFRFEPFVDMILIVESIYHSVSCFFTFNIILQALFHVAAFSWWF